MSRSPSLRLMLALSVMVATPALVHAEGLSARFRACVERAAANTVQRGLCAQSEVGGQDDRLNKAYQQVMRQLSSDPARKTALRDEQRSWLKQRDYECKVNGSTIDSACLVMRTAQRADQLETMIRF